MTRPVKDDDGQVGHPPALGKRDPSQVIFDAVGEVDGAFGRRADSNLLQVDAARQVHRRAVGGRDHGDCSGQSARNQAHSVDRPSGEVNAGSRALAAAQAGNQRLVRLWVGVDHHQLGIHVDHLERLSHGLCGRAAH